MHDTYCSDVGIRKVLAGSYVEMRPCFRACSEQFKWPGNEIVVGLVLLHTVYSGSPQVRSIVSEVFEGMLESRVKCLSCKKVTNLYNHGRNQRV